MTATHFLVRCEDDLDTSRTAGIFYRIRETPGVESIVDLGAVSRKTLDSLLLKPQPRRSHTLTRPRTSSNSAITH